MKTIGIIGGSTDLATAEYYRLINATVRERLGGLHTGEIVISSMDLAPERRVRPRRRSEEQAVMDDIIFGEISLGGLLGPGPRRRCLDVVDRLAVEEGAVGVVLGCTELPLLVRHEDRPAMPMFDTLTLHARAAALWAVAEDVQQKGSETS